MSKSEKLAFSEWVAAAYLAAICFTLIGIGLGAGIRNSMNDKEERIEWLELELDYQRQHCVCPKLGEER